jgi:hypothetical protein
MMQLTNEKSACTAAGESGQRRAPDQRKNEPRHLHREVGDQRPTIGRSGERRAGSLCLKITTMLVRIRTMIALVHASTRAGM